MGNSSERVISVILKGYPRLSETFITNEILLLEKLGLKLHIFALRNPGEAKVHDSVRRVRAQVTYIPDYFWPYFTSFIKANIKLWWKRPRVYWQAFRYAALRSLRRRSSSTIKRFAQAAYLVQNCLVLSHAQTNGRVHDCRRNGHSKKRPFDGRIVTAHFYAHFSHGPTTVAYFASWLTGISYSFSAHAKDIYLQEHEFLQRKIDQASFVVTCTEYNRRYLQSIAPSNGSVFRSYHGIDPDFFSLPVKSNHNERPRILSVGRFVPKKGFPVLIKALLLLRDRGHEFHCHMIGGGPMKSALQEQIVALGLDDCVELLAALDQRELFEYFRFADLFALACQVEDDGDRDGIPNVIVEAMAMEIPVVSTNISGIPECVDHGVNGFLVPPRDPAALAEAMASLLSQPETARAFGKAGRMKVESEFDAKRNVNRIAAALRQAVEGTTHQITTVLPEADFETRLDSSAFRRREAMAAAPEV